MSKALKQGLHARGADTRLQLKEALASLGTKELQAQSVWTVEHLLQRVEPQQLDGFVRDVFSGLKECMPAVRRLRYKLAAYALKLHAAKHWGQTLIFVRDKAVERIGHEENAETAQELRGVMQQLAGACIEAYCCGHFSSLGVASKDELPREWLCHLLIAPLIRAACRGSTKAKLGNGCLMVDGVLATFRKWQRSAAVLHSARECLKEMLRLAGAVALTASEVFLPIQSCVALLGSRLTGAAVHSILRMILAGMERREEWQVRKAATDTLAVLVAALLLQQQGTEGPRPESGLAALVGARLQLLATVEQYVKFDRIPQVRQAAVAPWQELQRLAPSQIDQGMEAPGYDPQRQQPTGGGGHPALPPAKAGYDARHATQHHQAAAAMDSAHPPLAAGASHEASPQGLGNSPRFVRPHLPAQHHGLDFGVQVFAPPVTGREQQQAPQEVQRHGATWEQEGEEQPQPVSVLALPSTASQLMEVPPQSHSQPQPHSQQEEQQQQRGGTGSGRASPQSAVHHVMHPLFTLQLQAEPLLVSVRATGSGGSAPAGQPGAGTLAGVEVRVEDVGDTCGPRLEVEVGMRLDRWPRAGDAGTSYCYMLQGGELLQRSYPTASSAFQPIAAQSQAALGASAPPARLQQQQQQQPNSEPKHSGAAVPAFPVAPPPQQPPKLLDSGGPCNAAGSPVRLAKLAGVGLPSFSPQRPAGRGSAELGMDSPAKRWAGSLRPLDAHAPLLPKPVEHGQVEASALPSRAASPGQRRASSPAIERQWQGGWQGSRPQSPAGRRRASAPAAVSPDEAAAAPPWQGRSDGGAQLDSTPRRQLPLERSLPQCDDATPASCPSYSLVSPQQCESPPYTPAMQQGRAIEPAQPAKGPLTAIVTRALSRLQQLEDLQHWQESVNSQLSGGSGGSAAKQEASDASSVKPVEARIDHPAAIGGRKLLPELQGVSDGTRAPVPRARGLGMAVHPRRSAAEPSLSAIPETSERSSSMPPASRQHLSEGGRWWEPAAAAGASGEAAGDDDGEMQRLLELQEKLQASMQDVQKRIHAQASGSHGEQLGLGAEDTIPAAWPQNSWGRAEEAVEYGGGGPPHQPLPDGMPRPDSQGSGTLSPQYGPAGEDDWLRHSNPLFNVSRPGTALTARQPLLAEDSELATVANQGQGGQRQGVNTAAEPVAFPEPAASLSTLSFRDGGGGVARSLQSLGSEFGIAGRDTEEEVQQFLRGSIASPAQHDALPQRRHCRQPSAAAAMAAAAAAAAGLGAAGDRAGGCGAGNAPTAGIAGGPGSRAERPPRPPSAAPRAALRPGCQGASSNAAAPEHAPGPKPRRERPRWAHLGQDAQQQTQPSPRSRPRSSPRARVVAAEQHAAVRGSIDLDAVLDSSAEPSPRSSGDSGPGGDHTYPAGRGMGFCGGQEEGVAECGGLHEPGQEPPTAALQLLHITSRPASPGVDRSIEEAGRGSISQVLQATFPDDALERLDCLRARLSPTRCPSAAPASQASSPQRSAPDPPSHRHCAVPADSFPQEQLQGGRRLDPEPGTPAGFSPRPPSPLASGLPISCRQAALLREAVRRHAGGHAAFQSTAHIQGALMDMLDSHTRDVEAYYQDKQDSQLALLRQQCGENLDSLQQVLEREGEVLRAASQQAARGEMQRFVGETLPRLADVLASKELLLHCFQILEQVG